MIEGWLIMWLIMLIDWKWLERPPSLNIAFSSGYPLNMTVEDFSFVLSRLYSPPPDCFRPSWHTAPTGLVHVRQCAALLRFPQCWLGQAPNNKKASCIRFSRKSLKILPRVTTLQLLCFGLHSEQFWRYNKNVADHQLELTKVDNYGFTWASVTLRPASLAGWKMMLRKHCWRSNLGISAHRGPPLISKQALSRVRKRRKKISRR